MALSALRRYRLGFMAPGSGSKVRRVGGGGLLALATLLAACSKAGAPGGGAAGSGGEPAGGAARTGGAAPVAPSAARANEGGAGGAIGAADGAAGVAGVAGAGGLDGEGGALLALIRAWDAALNARDAEALRPVYGATVRFYGRELAGEAALASKRAALAKAYGQTLGAVRFERSDPARPRATFAKRWTGPGGAAGEAEAVLVFAREGGRWVVAEESDAKTEARRAPGGESCEGAVIGLVAATGPARALLEGPTDPAHGHPSNGLRLGSTPPETPTYAVAVHESHDTHLATLAWFEVAPETGVVRQTMPDERVVPAPAHLAAKVRAACAGR